MFAGERVMIKMQISKKNKGMQLSNSQFVCVCAWNREPSCFAQIADEWGHKKKEIRLSGMHNSDVIRCEEETFEKPKNSISLDRLDQRVLGKHPINPLDLKFINSRSPAKLGFTSLGGEDLWVRHYKIASSDSLQSL